MQFRRNCSFTVQFRFSTQWLLFISKFKKAASRKAFWEWWVTSGRGSILQAKTTIFFDGIEKLIEICKKCIDVRGDYIEKLKLRKKNICLFLFHSAIFRSYAVTPVFLFFKNLKTMFSSKSVFNIWRNKRNMCLLL